MLASSSNDMKTSDAPNSKTDFHKFINLTAQSAIILYILINFKASHEWKKKSKSH